MIYLRNRYDKAGLPEPTTVTLFTEDVDWIKAQAFAEFSDLFPDSCVKLNPVDDDEQPVDLAVFVYREASFDLQELYIWGRHTRSHVSLGLGFYNLNPRSFEVVPVKDYPSWTRYQWFYQRMVRSVFPKFYRLVERGLSLCGFSS